MRFLLVTVDNRPFGGDMHLDVTDSAYFNLASVINNMYAKKHGKLDETILDFQNSL